MNSSFRNPSRFVFLLSVISLLFLFFSCASTSYVSFDDAEIPESFGIDASPMGWFGVSDTQISAPNSLEGSFFDLEHSELNESLREADSVDGFGEDLK